MSWKRLPLLLAAVLSPAAGAQSPPPAAAPPFPFAQVRAGLRGTGYTVFQGETVAPFSAEVLGTVEQGAAAPRAIVCRLSGANLEQTGVLAAMSGSPVYVDGKLLGALAYTWPFAKEPLCGVTPAEDLLSVGERGRRAEGAAGAAAPATVESFARALASAIPSRAPKAGAPDRWEKDPLLSRFAADGFAWHTPAATAETSAEPAGVSAALPGGAPPGPGGMIGVQLVSGDVQFTAFGTVSWVEGDRFLAFGHGLLGLGSAELPVVGAKVVATVPSLATGFKLSQAGAPLGVVTEDRPTGVYGRFGARARLLPVKATFRCRGVPAREFRFGAIRHPTLTPALVSGALSALYAQLEDPVEPKLVRLTSITLRLAGGRGVTLQDQSFSGALAMAAAAEYVSGVLELLGNNAHQPVPLEGLELAVGVEPGNRTAAVEAAWLSRNPVVRGESLTLSVRLRPFQGPPKVLTCSIPTSGLPPGEATLWAGGVFAVLPGLAAASGTRPADAEGYLRYLQEIPSGEKVTVAVAAQEPGSVLMHSRVGSLPPSVGSLLAVQPAAASATDSGKRLVWRSALDAEGAVSGLVEISFTVKEPAHE
jgi:hypothetical protein